MVDACAKIETEHLQYLRREQSALCADNFKELHDAIVAGGGDPRNVGQKVFLPATFTGDPFTCMRGNPGCDVICAHLWPTGPIDHNADKPKMGRNQDKPRTWPAGT